MNVACQVIDVEEEGDWIKESTFRATVVPKFVRRFLRPWARHFTLIIPWFGGYIKPLVPCTWIQTLIQACTLKYVTGYSKRAGDHPGTVDCTSKLHSSTLEKVQLVCTQCRNTHTYEFSTNKGRRRRRTRSKSPSNSDPKIEMTKQSTITSKANFFQANHKEIRLRIMQD